VDIYFLRHADAMADGERPLSEDGRKQTKKVGKGLRKLGVEVDAIYTSPLARAEQTAQIVGKILKVTPQVAEPLDSGAELSGLQALLAKHAPADRVMLVGHEPDFSMMVGSLIGAAKLDMKKTAVALVECGEVCAGGGLLKWLAPPKLIRD